MKTKGLLKITICYHNKTDSDNGPGRQALRLRASMQPRTDHLPRVAVLLKGLDFHVQ